MLSFAQNANAASVSAWELLIDDPFRNDSWSFGEIFTVGTTDIEVTALGAYDAGGDGFTTSGGIPVGIFRESDDSLLVSTFVQSTSSLIGHYRFASISPIILSANTSYRAVAVNRDDLYNIQTATPNFVDPRITWNSYGYCRTTALTSCDDFTGSERTWMANFQLDTPLSVPDSFSTGAGIVALSLGYFMLGILHLSDIGRRSPSRKQFKLSPKL